MIFESATTRESTGTRGAIRAALVEAGLKLMRERPYHSVSVREVASAAGVDPTAVTTEFGGRSGLVAQVAAAVAEDVFTRYLESDLAGDSKQAIGLLSELTIPIAAMADSPLLAELYIAELLLASGDCARLALHSMAIPYFENTLEALARAEQRGELRDMDPAVRLYAVTSLSLFHPFIGRWLRRHPDAPGAQMHPSTFALRLATACIYGCVEIAEQDGPSALRGGGADVSDDPAASECGGGSSPAQQTDFVHEAVAFLMANPDQEFTIEAVASWTGRQIADVQVLMSQRDVLMRDVARAAVALLPASRARAAMAAAPVSSRELGPDARRRLIESAIDLLSTVQGRVSTRQIARHAGYDPVLVSYHFGGSAGLLAEAACTVLTGLVQKFCRAHDNRLPVGLRLEKSLVPVIDELLRRPLLARFVLDQFLVRGTAVTDAKLAECLNPYVELIAADVEEGTAAGVFREEDPDIAFYAAGVMPLYFAAVIPTLHHTLRGPAVMSDVRSSARGLVQASLTGFASRPPA